MMRITKLLVLAAGVVAAACSGISPTSPNATVPSADATALAEATALKGRATPPDSSCRDITQVKLQLFRSPGLARVEAHYLNGDVTVNCRIAPDWSSRPRGRLLRTLDPFIVEVILTRPPSTVQVTAKAPNGIQGSLLVR